MDLTSAQRDARQKYLESYPHCAYCYHPSSTINYLPDNHYVPCCGECLSLLVRVPKKWDYHQRVHYLQTMQIRHPSTTQRTIKHYAAHFLDNLEPLH